MPDRISKDSHERMYDRRMECRREMDNFSECPKYLKHDISEEQVILIATRSVQIAFETLDKEVGKYVRKRLLGLVGIIIVGILGWLGFNNQLK
jgi:hypothetical protein